MAIRVIVAVAMLAMGCSAAAAESMLAVRLPDLTGLDRRQAEALLRELARVNVVTAGCPRYAIDDGEWTLITGTGDRLASQLGLDPAAYERRFYGPAFALLDDPTACERIGPRAKPLIGRLVRMGGGTASVTGMPHRAVSIGPRTVGNGRGKTAVAAARGGGVAAAASVAGATTTAAAASRPAGAGTRPGRPGTGKTSAGDGAGKGSTKAGATGRGGRGKGGNSGGGKGKGNGKGGNSGGKGGGGRQ